MSSKKYINKVIILGDSSVGKTSLMNKYIRKTFFASYKATIGADFLTKQINSETDIITLQLWDTAGNERFQSLGVAFYRGTDACILVFDITNQKSFQNLQHWYDEFLILTSPTNPESFPFILIGNKTDLVGESNRVSDKQIELFCRGKNIKYYPMSVKTEKGELVQILDEFTINVHNYHKKNNPELTQYNDIPISLPFKEDEVSNKCCNIL
jgi:Ras-related protein Rab-7A